MISRSRRLALGLCLVTAACSSSPSKPATHSVPAARVSVTTKQPTITPPTMTVSAADLHVETSWETPHYSVQWPVLKGFSALSKVIGSTVSGWRSDYAAEASGQFTDLTAAWEPVLNHSGLAGVRLTQNETGADSSERSVALYGDSTAAWTSLDLIDSKHRAALVTALGKAVAGATHESVDDGDVPDAKDVASDVSFSSDGTMLVRVQQGVLASMSKGVLYAQVANPQQYLSSVGQKVRTALMDSHASSAAAAPVPRTTSHVDCAKAKCIALTFDDGPGPYTDQILDTLQSKGAKATFFMLGPAVQADPTTVRRMVSLGMGLGDHSWSHPQFTGLSNAQVSSEITRQAAVLKQATGLSPVAVRPPYGAFTKTTPHEGYPFVLWDVDTEDWKNRSATITTQRALAGAHRGAIVLMHDIHPSTAKALPGIVDALKAKGYTLVTVSDLIPNMAKDKAYYSAP